MTRRPKTRHTIGMPPKTTQDSAPESNKSFRIRAFFARRPVKIAVVSLTALVTLTIIALVVWIVTLDRNISKRFAEKRFAPPIEFYSAPERILPGSRLPASVLEALFARKSYVKREFGQSMSAGDYAIWSGADCRSFLADGESRTTDRCVVFVNRGHGSEPIVPGTDAFSPLPTTTDVVAKLAGRAQLIELAADGTVLSVFEKDSLFALPFAVIEPELFAQYYGDKPVLRNVVSFASGEVPPLCLNALLAIEDDKFYEHSGISLTGLARAFVTNLRSGRKAQGGSTITQQLVKNYFLTEERTFKRKFTEIAMAFLVERHASKDDILETYINLIYMGQNGVFEVRGFSAASQHYFGKPLRDLNLPECALLAGVLNGPGVYDPVKHPDRALKRRTRVLERMHEVGFIDEQKQTEANAFPLPKQPERNLTEPAPYYVQAVRREIESKGLSTDEGARIYTGLNLRAQEAAQQSVRQGLDRLETTYANIKNIKASGKNLEAVFLSADPETGFIQSLVGGRGFTATQYNRAIDARRQVGSFMKPFVYLTAFESLTPQGQPYTPLTLLQDVATTHKFDNQVWTPKNYEGTYNGEVPMYWALKESLNAATVNLGMAVGIDSVVETAHRMGITSKLKPLPSLTLGAFELSPLEVLQAYTTISRFGQKVPLTLIDRVESLSGEALYKFEGKPEQAAAPDAVAELVGSMKQTIMSGTGRGARLAGFTHPAAGKSGTTNDKKDAWFAGFTPNHVALVWVGYDDNTSHNLTGGGGGTPIWTQYMKAYASSYPPVDFAWPEGTEVVTFQPDQLIPYGVPESDLKKTVDPVQLVFKRGQGPVTAGSVNPAAPLPGFPTKE